MKLNKMSYFRILLVMLILVANLILQLINIDQGWVIFISNIILFTMSGNIRKNFIQIEVGGLTGLLFAEIAIIGLYILTPFIGIIASVMLLLIIIIPLVILLNPIVPIIFNNCTFAYFTCALINPNYFLENFGSIIIIFFIGTLLVNGLSVLLFVKLVGSLPYPQESTTHN